MALDIRFVVYAPNGAWVGVLPAVTRYVIGHVLNDLPSLQLTYSKLGLKYEWLTVPCEVAVEYSDWNDQWVEPPNGRFINLADDLDLADEAGSVEFTMPGYAFVLSKAIMTMTTAQRSRNGKRDFGEASAGGILHAMCTEAKARGSLPGVTWAFTAAADSGSRGWSHERTPVSFDPGTTILAALRSFSEQGLCDWDMSGRALRLYNPNGELGAPRADRRALVQTAGIDVLTMLADASSNLSSSAGDIAQKTPDGVVRFGLDAAAVAQRGVPQWRSSTDEWVLGQDVTSLKYIGALIQDTDPGDGSWTAYGNIVTDYNAPTRVVLAVNNVTSGLHRHAYRAFQLAGGSTIVMAGSDFDLGAHNSTKFGYGRMLSNLCTKRIPIVEFDVFQESDMPATNIIVDCNAGVETWWAKHMVNKWNAIPGGVARFLNNRNQIVGRPDLSDDIKWKPNGLANLARANGCFYMRIQVSSASVDNVGHHTNLGNFIREILDLLNPPELAVTGAKPVIGLDPEDPARLGPVDLRLGRDIIEAPTRGSIEDMAGRVYVYGDQWITQTVLNQDADNFWGIWETTIGAGGVADTEMLANLAYDAINKGNSKRYEYTRGVDFLRARWLYFKDYDCGDYVLSPDASGTYIPMRINQATITGDSGAISGSFVMSDRFLSIDRKMQKAVSAASGGSVGGSLTATPARPVAPVFDPRKPLPPTRIP